MNKASISSHLLRWRHAYLLVSVLATVICFAQLSKLTFEADTRTLFSKSEVHHERLLEMEALYKKSELLLIFIESTSGDIFSRRILGAVHAATEEAWLLPYASSVLSLSNFQHVTSDVDTFTVQALIRDEASIDPDRIKQIALDSERIEGTFVLQDGATALIMVHLSLPDDKTEAIPALMERAEQLKRRYESQYPDLRLYLNGEAAVSGAFQQVPQADGQLLFPLAILTILLLLGISLRSVTAVVTCFVVVVATVVTTAGLTAALGFSLNAISVNALVLTSILGVADSVHLLSYYILGKRRGALKRDAMEQSIEKNLVPVFLTSITTAVGFLGINFSDAPAYADMGNITAIGVLVALCYSFALLPAAALLLPSRTPRGELPLNAMLGRLSGIVTKENKAIFYGTLLIAAVSISLIPRLHVDDDFSRVFDESLDIHRSIEFTTDALGSQYLLYSFDSGSEHGVNDPEFLRKVDAFSSWIETHPNVSNVTSYIDVVKTLNRSMNGDDPDWYRIPNDRELASQLLLLYELSLPLGIDLTRDIDYRRSSLRMRVNVIGPDNKSIIEVEEQADDWLRENMPELRSVPTSNSLVMAHMGNSITRSMVTGSGVVLAIITLVMIVGLRSLKYGVVSIVPNVLPAVIAYGLFAAFVQEVNQTIALTFSVSLGLVIDDTVHMLSKYVEGQAMGYSREDAIHYAFTTCGPALVITTCILGIGISLLLFSNFVPNQMFATLMTSIIVLALVLDLVFLPSLLMRLGRGERSQDKSANLVRTEGIAS